LTTSQKPASPGAFTATLEQRQAHRLAIAPVVDEYLATLGTDESRRTTRNAIARFARAWTHANPTIPLDDADVLWSRLSANEFSAVLAVMRDAPATVNQSRHTVMALMATLYRRSEGVRIDRDRLARFERLPRVHAEGQRRPGRSLSAAERQALYAACAVPPYDPEANVVAHMRRYRRCRDAVLLALLDGCGLRRSAACRLTWGDVMPEHIFVTEKGRRERFIPMPPKVWHMLLGWQGLRSRDLLGHEDYDDDFDIANRMRTGPLLPKTSPVLCRVRVFSPKVDGRWPPFCGTSHPQPLTTHGLYKALEAIASRAGVAHFTPHDLRRTFHDDLTAAGVDIGRVSALMGHKSVTTTQLYDRRPAQGLVDAIALRFIPWGGEK
jgi:integrase